MCDIFAVLSFDFASTFVLFRPELILKYIKRTFLYNSQEYNVSTECFLNFDLNMFITTLFVGMLPVKGVYRVMQSIY